MGHLKGIISELERQGFQIESIPLSERCRFAYEPKTSLGLFGFSEESQAKLKKYDPEVQIETSGNESIMKFSRFHLFPPRQTLISLWGEDQKKATARNFSPESKATLMEKYNVALGFFSTSKDLSYRGEEASHYWYSENLP